MGATVTQRSTSTRGDLATDDDVALEHPWNVVVWNDPVTPMSVVVVILRKIFKYSNAKATQLMMAVHNEGRAIVWSGEKDRAQGFCVQLHAHGLHASIEQDA